MQTEIFLKASSRKLKKRVGRGGKKGTYSGRGMKGQKSRRGFSQRPTFEGGKSSLVAVTKKLKGFKSFKKLKTEVVKLAEIEKKFQEGEKINKEALLLKGIRINPKNKIKVLLNGKEKGKKFIFNEVVFSQKAREFILKSGGKILEDQKK